MANETIYPYGVGGQTPSGIGLNAGTFADAYDLAKENNYIFPWMLIDEDEEGEPIKKMIWHTGNGEFIDAIGAKVDGVKNGVTVTTEVAGYMRIWDGTSDMSSYHDHELVVGENNFSFEDLKGQKTSGFDTHHSVEFVNSSKTAFLKNSTDVFSVDFGGMKFTRNNYSDSETTHGGISGSKNLFSGYKGVKSIKRIGLNFSAGNPGTIDYFKGCSKLEYIQIVGHITSSSSYYITNWFQGCNSLVKCDMSGLESTAKLVYGFFSSCNKLEYLDMRGFDFSTMTGISNLIRGSALKTVILGNCDTSNVKSSSGFMSGVSGATLVLTETTPPTFNIDFIDGHFTTIKVPSAALTDYQEASGWSTYANIMSSYEEGEY